MDSDSKLHSRILLALDSQPELRQLEIGIAVRDGVVTLTGYVNSDEQRHAAERAVSHVPGVAAIAADLRVHLAEPHEPTDTEIAHAVVGLLECCGISPSSLRARVDGGWVTLEGEVDLFHQKTGLERRVADLAGVRGISNLVTVRPPELVNDIDSKLDVALLDEAAQGIAPPPHEPPPIDKPRPRNSRTNRSRDQ